MLPMSVLTFLILIGRLRFPLGFQQSSSINVSVTIPSSPHLHSIFIMFSKLFAASYCVAFSQPQFSCARPYHSHAFISDRTGGRRLQQSRRAERCCLELVRYLVDRCRPEVLQSRSTNAKSLVG